MVVPQRSAKDACAAGSKELRYVRSDSIPSTLPVGKVLSIPSGHLPIGTARYADEVAESLQDLIFETRRTRFRELVETYGGPTEFAREVEKRLRAEYPELADSLKSFTDVSYISRAKNGGKTGKAIGEAAAMELELLFKKEPGWMTGDTFDNFLIRMRRRRRAAS
jgi:hypothetical protein